MEVNIYINNIYGKARNDRKGVIVEIKNNGSVFKWLPTYRDVAKIKRLLSEVEDLNADKCKKPYNFIEYI